MTSRTETSIASFGLVGDPVKDEEEDKGLSQVCFSTIFCLKVEHVSVELFWNLPSSLVLVQSVGGLKQNSCSWLLSPRQVVSQVVSQCSVRNKLCPRQKADPSDEFPPPTIRNNLPDCCRRRLRVENSRNCQRVENSRNQE